MKSIGIAAVSVVVGFLVCLLVIGRPLAHGSSAGQGGGAPTANGDVNGDTKIDISDAIYLLSRLFTGGPAPVPIECPAPTAAGPEASGQTKCYGDLEGQWVEMPCDSTACLGQDGTYTTGCPSEGRFTDNGDGTVTDHCTGLMWQKETGDVDGDGAVTALDFRQWCGALAYCEDLSLAGHDDWRLPNVVELHSLLDYGRTNPSIDPIFGTFPGAYFSSTSFALVPLTAWTVVFLDGGVTPTNKGSSTYVRAVRGG